MGGDKVEGDLMIFHSLLLTLTLSRKGRGHILENLFTEFSDLRGFD